MCRASSALATVISYAMPAKLEHIPSSLNREGIPFWPEV
jgi:hypothetical protein